MPYKTQSEDTHPVVEKLQFDHLRRMGRKERFERGLARMDDTLATMWNVLRRHRPHATPEQLHVEWARVQFGEEFAQKLEEHIQCRTLANIETPSAGQ